MLKIFYDKFWYPFFGKILSYFVSIIEGQNVKKLKSINNKQLNNEKNNN